MNHWRFLLPILVAALVGCEPAPVLGPKAPHGGTILPIPGEKGSAEFVLKRVEGPGEQVQFVVHFYGPDDKPLSPSPPAGTFKPSGRASKPIDLKPTEGADGSLTSSPTPSAGEVEGELSVTIDGKAVTIPIKAR